MIQIRFYVFIVALWYKIMLKQRNRKNSILTKIFPLKKYTEVVWECLKFVKDSLKFFLLLGSIISLLKINHIHYSIRFDLFIFEYVFVRVCHWDYFEVYFNGYYILIYNYRNL